MLYCKQFISQFLGSFFSPFRNKSEVDDLFEGYTRVTLDEEEEAEIIYDKRKINSGRPEGNFDTFYKGLDQILEEFGKAADERRNSQVAHLSIAVSVPQFISKILRYFMSLIGVHSIMNVSDRCSLD